MAVVSLVSARVASERREEMRRQFAETVGLGLPAAIRQTFLLEDEDEMAIATAWRSREDLDTVRAAPEEPFARRVLREAGGEPVARFFDVTFEAPTQSP